MDIADYTETAPVRQTSIVSSRSGDSGKSGEVGFTAAFVFSAAAALRHRRDNGQLRRSRENRFDKLSGGS